MCRLRVLLALMFGAATLNAIAWNGSGHEQIADVAWSQLTHRAKVQIALILMSGDHVIRDEQDHTYGVPHVDPSALDDKFLEETVRPAFRLAATWPDDIKGGKSTVYDARVEADNAASPGVTSGRGEDVRCKTWHYYDDPINAPGDAAAHPARASNALRALNMELSKFRQVSRTQAPDRTEQLYDLFWIEHIVGDLHQPLHCSESYVLNPEGDAGGNRLMIVAPGSYRPGRRLNLHAFWDDGIDHAIEADHRLGDQVNPEQVTREWLLDRADQPSPKEVRDLNVMHWIEQGHELAISKVYAGITPMRVPSPEYVADHEQLCKRQTLLAGFRLARILNKDLS